MSRYITIDGGTTNTRVSLAENGCIKDTVKIHLGAKAGIDNNAALGEHIKKAIDELSENTERIDAILASGMITSEFGLCNVPHIKAPAGIKELHDNICKKSLPDISSVPFYFIPGVKILEDELSKTDMMRGEETELFGLCREVKTECLYILPGSHSKIIKTDECGRIKDFATLLTGEMIAALSGGTILKSSVNLDKTDIDEQYLSKGFSFCDKHGLNEALFKVRILDNIYKADENQRYSFFLGAVLHDEIKEIIKCTEKDVIIGGKNQIKNAMQRLLVNFSDKRIEIIPDSLAEIAPQKGMIRIFEIK